MYAAVSSVYGPPVYTYIPLLQEIVKRERKREETDNLTFKSMEDKCVRVIKDSQLP